MSISRRPFLSSVEILGYADAQYNLALMYNNGEGVPQDYALAVEWYRKAAEQGYGGILAGTSNR
jgi:TPR repeat protein